MGKISEGLSVELKNINVGEFETISKVQGYLRDTHKLEVIVKPIFKTHGVDDMVDYFTPRGWSYEVVDNSKNNSPERLIQIYDMFTHKSKNGLFKHHDDALNEGLLSGVKCLKKRYVC